MVDLLKAARDGLAFLDVKMNMHHDERGRFAGGVNDYATLNNRVISEEPAAKGSPGHSVSSDSAQYEAGDRNEHDQHLQNAHEAFNSLHTVLGTVAVEAGKDHPSSSLLTKLGARAEKLQGEIVDHLDAANGIRSDYGDHDVGLHNIDQAALDAVPDVSEHAHNYAAALPGLRGAAKAFAPDSSKKPYD